jgi:hypothetical protein
LFFFECQEHDHYLREIETEEEGSIFVGGIQREWMADRRKKGPQCSSEAVRETLYRQGACKIGSTTGL